MSKIGRKPIDINKVKVDIQGQEIHLTGSKGSMKYMLPPVLKAELVDHMLKIACNDTSADTNMKWGLHRALLANTIKGMAEGFAQKVIITGLGYKAVVSGNKAIFSLGKSHKIELEIPAAITIEVDKTGQLVTVKGVNKELVGFVASKIRDLRPTEPYKGTGIKLEHEVILRKAGKTKAAA